MKLYSDLSIEERWFVDRILNDKYLTLQDWQLQIDIASFYNTDNFDTAKSKARKVLKDLYEHRILERCYIGLTAYQTSDNSNARKCYMYEIKDSWKHCGYDPENVK